MSAIDFIYAKMQTINEPTGVNYIGGHQVTFSFILSIQFINQTTFTRKAVFNYMPYLDASLKIMADNKWQMTFFKRYESKTLLLIEWWLFMISSAHHTTNA